MQTQRVYDRQLDSNELLYIKIAKIWSNRTSATAHRSHCKIILLSEALPHFVLCANNEINTNTRRIILSFNTTL